MSPLIASNLLPSHGAHDVRVNAAFLRKVDSHYVLAGTVLLHEDVLLAIECSLVDRRASVSCQLSVELWRGETRRDCHTDTIQVSADRPWRVTYRVTWSGRPDASSRLTSRILIDDCEAASCQVLITHLAVDPQGRFPGAPQRMQSAATMLAYQREYGALLQRLATRRLHETGSQES